MGLVRSLISLTLLACFLFFGATVPLGSRTLFGHVANIWHSEEAQELVEGVKESSGPVVERVKRGVEAGLSDEPATEVSTNEDEETPSTVQATPPSDEAPPSTTAVEDDKKTIVAESIHGER